MARMPALSCGTALRLKHRNRTTRWDARTGAARWTVPDSWSLVQTHTFSPYSSSTIGPAALALAGLSALVAALGLNAILVAAAPLWARSCCMFPVASGSTTNIPMGSVARGVRVPPVASRSAARFRASAAMCAVVKLSVHWCMLAPPPLISVAAGLDLSSGSTAKTSATRAHAKPPERPRKVNSVMANPAAAGGAASAAEAPAAAAAADLDAPAPVEASLCAFAAGCCSPRPRRSTTLAERPDPAPPLPSPRPRAPPGAPGSARPKMTQLSTSPELRVLCGSEPVTVEAVPPMDSTSPGRGTAPLATPAWRIAADTAAGDRRRSRATSRAVPALLSSVCSHAVCSAGDCSPP
mmetsp:Transcript_11845/g.46256  ORF Transcript_11845/g.46256 Transcript_11845/m.46256 type:complete len:352 (+) Transcript_11845:2388-3443(+)